MPLAPVLRVPRFAVQADLYLICKALWCSPECLSFRQQAAATAELARGATSSGCSALRDGAMNLALVFALQLQIFCLCSCVPVCSEGDCFIVGGNRFSAGFFLAGYCFVVVVWNSVWGPWTLSPHFFLFPFLSFEFSFLKRFLFLKAGVKARRFHFLWEKSDYTDVCLIPPLVGFSSPHCLDADNGCLKYKGKVKITGCPSFLIVFLAVASQPFAGRTHIRLGRGNRILSPRNNCFSE